MSIRHAIYLQLEPRARNRSGLSPANWILSALIVVASLVAILETEPTLSVPYARQFQLAQLVFGLIFLVEYALRVWAAGEDPRFGGHPMGRFRWMLTPSGIIDLIALSPIFIAALTTNLFWVRLARILRIMRIARLGRMSRAFDNLTLAIYRRRFELFVTISIALLLMLFSATLLYFAEGRVQPEQFGSVPRALWWSIVTLTTIGYGDVYPVTALGKVFAAFIAICGIGVIAMPTGILAATFTEILRAEDRAEDCADAPDRYGQEAAEPPPNPEAR